MIAYPHSHSRIRIRDNLYHHLFWTIFDPEGERTGVKLQAVADGRVIAAKVQVFDGSASQFIELQVFAPTEDVELRCITFEPLPFRYWDLMQMAAGLGLSFRGNAKPEDDEDDDSLGWWGA